MRSDGFGNIRIMANFLIVDSGVPECALLRRSKRTKQGQRNGKGLG